MKPGLKGKSARAGVFLLLSLLLLDLCARAATLQERIDAAAPGATLVVDPGTYRGRIVIRKPLTLISKARALIQGDGKDKVVRIEADDVTLRGFRIAGSGLELSDDDAAVFVTGNRATIEDNQIEDSLHGVYLKKVRNGRVLGNRIRGKTTLASSTGSVESEMGRSPDNCDDGALGSNRRGNGIHQWNCEGNLVARNDIADTRDGIYFSFTSHSRAENNKVSHVRYGLHYMYSDSNVLENNTFEENAAGAALMFSKGLLLRDNHFITNSGYRAYGLLLQSVDNSRIEQNEIRHNAVGISINQCNANTFAANTISGNYIGMRFDSNSDANRFTQNVFGKNLHPVELQNDGTGNQWAVKGVGNLWDGSESLDLDGDGVSDLPHRELDLFGVLRRDFPAIALLSESPAVKLLRFANQRAALPGVNSIEDRAPLTPGWWKIQARRAAEAIRGAAAVSSAGKP